MRKKIISGVIFYITLLIFSTDTLIYAIQNPETDVEIETIDVNAVLPSGWAIHSNCFLNEGDNVIINFNLSDYDYRIDLYVVDEENFERWVHRNSFIFIYGKLRVSSSGGYNNTFTVNPSGHYYIVFYNYDLRMTVDIEYEVIIYHYISKPFNPINLVFPIVVWIIGIVEIIVIIVRKIRKKEVIEVINENEDT